MGQSAFPALNDFLQQHTSSHLGFQQRVNYSIIFIVRRSELTGYELDSLGISARSHICLLDVHQHTEHILPHSPEQTYIATDRAPG